MLIDKELPWKILFAENGIELFSIFFKLTFYDDNIEHSVSNLKDGKIELHEDHDNLCWVISQIKRIESQINFVVNNLLLKHITACSDKKQMLVYLAELLYSPDGFKSTKRCAKLMSLFTTMYKQVNVKDNERRNYMMGTLFVIAGLLKIEAKSFLNTCKKTDATFK